MLDDETAIVSVDLSVIDGIIAEDVESINLMYRLQDAPHTIELISTKFDNKVEGIIENELPVALHRDHAIVTAL